MGSYLRSSTPRPSGQGGAGHPPRGHPLLYDHPGGGPAGDTGGGLHQGRGHIYPGYGGAGEEIDLATEMVRLMGKEGQVEVRVAGLRPGEKLH